MLLFLKYCIIWNKSEGEFLIKREFDFKDSEGKLLKVYQWVPKENIIVRGIIQISHGMTETALRYEEFAKFLNENGFVVYAHDHRGHGFTVSNKNELGYIADNEGFNWLVKDLRELNLYIKKQNKKLPIILFGHSMGSFVAQRFVELYGQDIQGVMLSGTNGKPSKLTGLGIFLSKLEIIIFGRTHRSKVMNKLIFGKFNNKFKPSRTDFDWLCSVNEEVDKYINNEYCGFICTASFYYDLLRGLKDIHKKENLNKIPKNLPILIFAGDKDPVGNFGIGIISLYNMFKKLNIEDVKYKLYVDGRHEMLNEFEKENVMKYIVDWLLKRIKN